MKNVTVSLDEQVYRQARIVAAERGTSLSALVKAYLETLGSGESEFERLRKAEQALRDRVGDFRGGYRVPRDEVHERRGE